MNQTATQPLTTLELITNIPLLLLFTLSEISPIPTFTELGANHSLIAHPILHPGTSALVSHRRLSSFFHPGGYHPPLASHPPSRRPSCDTRPIPQSPPEIEEQPDDHALESCLPT